MFLHRSVLPYSDMMCVAFGGFIVAQEWALARELFTAASILTGMGSIYCIPLDSVSKRDCDGGRDRYHRF